MKIPITVVLAIACLGGILSPSLVAQPERQIRYLLFMTGPGEGLSPHRPERITPAAFRRIMENFDGLPPSHIEVGLSMIVSYLHHPEAKTQEALRRFLAAAQATHTPITIKLDGEQWWAARPDLWNWWDPDAPGYDPENVHNVEWTGWSPDQAVKIGWRNWGRQLRVDPAPNLMSPEYQAACQAAMEPLLALIYDWWRELPPDRRDLLVGIEVGWESAIGVNNYYYENGNSRLEADPAEDVWVKPDRRGDLVGRGRVPLGFAAVSTAGLASSGDLRYEHLVEVVRRHLLFQSRIARAAGFPREKVFTHGWGNEDGELLYDAAVNEYTCPGWSSYWYSNRLEQDEGINRGIDQSDAPYWAAVEWLFLHRINRQAWKDAFENTITHRNCRYLTYYNWNRIATAERGGEIIAAVRELVEKYSFARVDERARR